MERQQNENLKKNQDRFYLHFCKRSIVLLEDEPLAAPIDAVIQAKGSCADINDGELNKFPGPNKLLDKDVGPPIILRTFFPGISLII